MSWQGRSVLTAGAVGVVTMGLVGVILVSWHAQTDRAMAAEAPMDGNDQPQPLDALTWSRVCEVRRGLRLSDGTLAAMGCDGETAEAALKKVLAWYETNSAAWETACAQVAAARKALRTAVRRVNVGPRSGAVLASIPGLKAAVADAERARADLLAARSTRSTCVRSTESPRARWLA